MDHHRYAQGLGYCIDGDIIVRGPDPAGGEQVIVADAQRVDRFDNRGGIVGHHAHFSQADALHPQPRGNLRDILVLRAARQDLVADNEQGGFPDAVVHAAEG